MSTTDKIIEETMSWIGTKYHHQARVKGIGVDCAQLVAGVAEKVFEKAINTPTYSVEWHLHNREELMCDIIESFGCRRISDATPGSILTFKFGRVNSHMGIMVNDHQFVHARIDVGRVVLNELSGDWIKRLGRVYEFPL